MNTDPTSAQVAVNSALAAVALLLAAVFAHVLWCWRRA